MVNNNMVNNNKEMLRSILVLTVIALISGILLSAVFQVTALTQEEKDRKVFKTLNSIYDAPDGYEKLDYNGNNKNVIAIYRAKNTERYTVIGKGKGKNGNLEMYVTFSGREIIDVRPGTVKDDPGYKDAIYAQSYLNQFKVNIDTNLFEKYGNGNDFDAASGATYSSKGALEAIRNAVDGYKYYYEEAGL
jgi:Na+-translocating ferredoxin:NAD+ oxidoreductase RnfG subunit